MGGTVAEVGEVRECEHLFQPCFDVFRLQAPVLEAGEDLFFNGGEDQLSISIIKDDTDSASDISHVLVAAHVPPKE